MDAISRLPAHTLFTAVDTMDVTPLDSLFAAGGRVVFGNGEPLGGIDDIRTGTRAFYSTIAGLHHEIVNEWNVGDDTLVE